MRLILHGEPVDVTVSPTLTLNMIVMVAHTTANRHMDYLNTEIRDEKGRLLDGQYPLEAYRFEDEEKVFVNLRPGTGA